MQILPPGQYHEYEAFVGAHPNGGITQSVLWHGVKDNWGREVVVSRDSSGVIIGGVSVLIRRLPPFGTSMLYSPRGPVCDLHNADVLIDLKKGIDEIAGRYNAHIYKTDPDIPRADRRFAAIAKGMGFQNNLGGDGFETIQARFNYRLYIEGRSEEELLANMVQKTRYNVRVAQKHGVEVKVAGKDALDDFTRLMRVTGERDGFSVRPKSYFEKMLDCLGEHCRLYMAYYDGKAVSGAITTNYAGKACYIYGASDNAHRNVMSNYLIQWEMIRWAVRTGCAVYDFQGVSGNLSEGHPLYGLYRFKKGFNGTLDELAGEFDFIYMPLRAKLTDKAIALAERIRNS